MMDKGEVKRDESILQGDIYEWDIYYIWWDENQTIPISGLVFELSSPSENLSVSKDLDVFCDL